MAHEYDISRVSVFDGSGSKTASVGRKGAGPGEYEAIGEIIVSPLDSVFVIDAHADRISVLDPRLRFVRTEPLPLNSAEADVLPDGSFLFNATVGTRDALGYPLHVVRNGRIVGSFGAVDPIYRRDMPNLGKRTISRIRGRHVWIAHWGRYRLERWNVETRTLERTIERPVPWFPDVSQIRRRGGEKPVTQITGIHEDARGRIWVAITVADDDWESARRLRGSLQGFQVYNVTSFKDYYDTTLECIDGSSGQVIASVRLDEIVHGFTPDDLLIIYDETESGESFIELRRPILTIEPQIGR